MCLIIFTRKKLEFFIENLPEIEKIRQIVNTTTHRKQSYSISEKSHNANRAIY